MAIKRYHASCKCGAVRFAVNVDATMAVPCICARCRGQGLRVAHLQRFEFSLLTGADNLTERLHEARTPHHFFCRTCGEASFGFSGDTVSVNIACLERGDPAAIAHNLDDPHRKSKSANKID